MFKSILKDTDNKEKVSYTLHWSGCCCCCLQGVVLKHGQKQAVASLLGGKDVLPVLSSFGNRPNRDIMFTVFPTIMT